MIMWRNFASIRLFFWLLGLIISACVIGAVIPQGEEIARYQDLFGSTAASLIVRLGFDRLFSSAWFNVLLALLGVNLAACSAIRLKTIRQRPGGFVTHVAVLVILSGALIRGIFGVHGSLPMRVGETRSEFLIGESATAALPFQIRLDRFQVERRSAGRDVLHFVDDETKQSESLEINGVGAYHLNPLAADVRVIGVYPDFILDENGPATRSNQPLNPAVHIEIVKNGHASKRWLFAKHPDFEQHGADAEGEMSCCAKLRATYEHRPGDIGQFRSTLSIVDGGKTAVEKTIHVNEPLTYRGHTFYQSGYDPDDPAFSSLQVSKDPSVPIVYAGFALLPIGLIWSFLPNKKGDGVLVR